jgi:hypothetical protein
MIAELNLEREKTRQEAEVAQREFNGRPKNIDGSAGESRKY